MIGEREPFATKELKGVRYTENNASSLLEQHLGIIIPSHPKTVVLTPRNRLALYKNNENFRRTKRFSLINVVLKDSIKYFGYFSCEFNTCILRERPNDRNRTTSFHEVMHAFVDQTNPDIYLEIQSNIAKGLRNHTDFDYEAAEGYYIFEEGIASWGALEASTLIKGKNVAARNKEHQGWIETLLNASKSDSIEQNFKEINERVDAWSKLLDIYSPSYNKNSKKYDKLMKNQAIQGTACGHHFVNQIISKLGTSGINTADALNLLVIHPPASPRMLDQLEDPVAYAEELIVYYIRESGRLPKKN
ncbi:MAG: hypothetical protein HYT11_03095 [Candidatus Levybacteria bacterium]|nr:hypothetical protein [Candidatus Levybacteria bacterium]